MAKQPENQGTYPIFLSLSLSLSLSTISPFSNTKNKQPKPSTIYIPNPIKSNAIVNGTLHLKSSWTGANLQTHSVD